MALRFEPGAAGACRTPLTIRHLLESSLAAGSRRELVYRDSVRLSYPQVRRRVGSLASALRGMGVGEGTTVAVLDWDSHRYLEAYFAVPMMGAVLQTVNVRLAPAQILYTLQHAGAEVLLVHHDFLPLVEEMRAALPAVRRSSR